MAYQDPTGQSATDKKRQQNEIQRGIVMLGDDIRKKVREKEELVAEIRGLKKDEERTKLELQKKEGELQKVDQEISQLDKSTKDLEKKQNAL